MLTWTLVRLLLGCGHYQPSLSYGRTPFVAESQCCVGEGEEREERESDTAVENEVPPPMAVCGQRAHQTVCFWPNPVIGPHQAERGSSLLGFTWPLNHQEKGLVTDLLEEVKVKRDQEISWSLCEAEEDTIPTWQQELDLNLGLSEE